MTNGPANSSEQLTPRPAAMPVSRGSAWLSAGFSIFKQSAGAWVGVTVLLLVITLAVSLIPLLGSLATYILSTFFFAGLMLGCKAQEQGDGFTVNHLFAGFSQNAAQLLVLGGLYLAANIIILLLVLVCVLVLPGGGLDMIERMASASANPEEMRAMLSFYALIVLIAMALYVPVIMGYWFAPALVILQDVSAFAAIRLSFMGCLMNIMPFLVYGIIVLFFSIIAAIPFGLGFLILFPVVAGSIYAAYREIFA